MNFDEYLAEFGPEIVEAARERLDPIHVPGRDQVESRLGLLLRAPYPAQAEVITALAKLLRQQSAGIVVGEMGTGKTAVGSAIAHVSEAAGVGYRALVMAPGHLTQKWRREILETIPGASATVIGHWSEALQIPREKPTHPEWWIVGRDRVKLVPGWRPATWKRLGKDVCSGCGRQPTDAGAIIAPSALAKRKLRCEHCGEPLWQWTPEPRRWPPGRIVKRRLKGRVDFLIGDETHELKGEGDTLQADAFSDLVSVAGKTLALTGTVTGGSASHLFYLLWRLFPDQMKAAGFDWRKPSQFDNEYGRREATCKMRITPAGVAGRVTRTYRTVPGIMPSLFGDFVMRNAAFLSLEDVADHLPAYEEKLLGVGMEPGLEAHYQHVESCLMAACKELLARGENKLLGVMLHTLLSYPDTPFNWDAVGYREVVNVNGEAFEVARPVVTPPSLDPSVTLAKERALLDVIQDAWARRRQVWVYVQYTGEHDCGQRLANVIQRAGFKARTLRTSDATPDKREAWIQKHAPDVDVMISQAKLVETGVDLFDKGGSYNFPTIVFYQCGYSLFTLRQAARRAWRLSQKEDCETIYMYWRGTLQERALALMGRKLSAAELLEGKFSSEGLVAMNEMDSAERELAKSLMDRIPEDAARSWKKQMHRPAGKSLRLAK